MKTFQTLTVSLILIAISLAFFCYKVYYLDFPVQPNKETKSWHIEAKVSILAQGKPVKLSMTLPQNYSRFVLIDENFISDGYGLSTRIDEAGNRIGTWSKRSARGEQTFFYQAVLYEFDSNLTSDATYTSSPIPEKIDRSNLPESMTEGENAYFVVLDSVIAEIRERSADESTFILELYKWLNTPGNENVVILKQQGDRTLDTEQLASLILNESGIPARIVNGVHLEKERRFAHISKWVEVYVQKAWKPINSKNGRFGLEEKLFRWWIGNDNPLVLEGGRRADIKVSVKENTEEAMNIALWKGKESNEMLLSFSLFSLPIDTQLVFQVILLIPVGGLVMAFLRQIVGFRTFGTFMPVLVAISFRETQLLAGVVLFVTVVTIGLFIRAYFDRLQLLFVPRLSAVLTIVVLLISLLTVLTHKLGINAGLSISLFPMVIMTMTIERMSITWEESGPRQSISTGINSLLASVISYLCMTNQYVTHLMFVFPELLLVVLGISIMIGRYHGYKLTEYFRFKALSKVGK